VPFAADFYTAEGHLLFCAKKTLEGRSIYFSPF
jgi:hypothetical protein